MNRTTTIGYTVVSLSTIAVSLFFMEQTLVVVSAVAAGLIATILAIVSIVSAVIRHRSLRPAVLGFTAAAVVLVSVAYSHWPFRAAYLMSRPALERAAAEVRSGHSFVDRRVGLFFVRRAEVSNGVVCLWVNTNPAGRTGFAQTSPGYIPFNLWSVTTLDTRWQFISED